MTAGVKQKLCDSGKIPSKQHGPLTVNCCENPVMILTVQFLWLLLTPNVFVGQSQQEEVQRQHSGSDTDTTSLLCNPLMWQQRSVFPVRAQRAQQQDKMYRKTKGNNDVILHEAWSLTKTNEVLTTGKFICEHVNI